MNNANSPHSPFSKAYERGYGHHMNTVIYHLARQSGWQAALQTGIYDGTAEDRVDGYLHFSTASQVIESARKHRAGETDIVLLTVDAAVLGPALMWEPARGGDLFPHLYGSLDVSDVSAATALALAADGQHIFPPLDDCS
jgi:uncharacterized protein (DUF952 family)